jgi:hypothetical protein
MALKALTVAINITNSALHHDTCGHHRCTTMAAITILRLIWLQVSLPRASHLLVDREDRLVHLHRTMGEEDLESLRHHSPLLVGPVGRPPGRQTTINHSLDTMATVIVKEARG